MRFGIQFPVDVFEAVEFREVVEVELERGDGGVAFGEGFDVGVRFEGMFEESVGPGPEVGSAPGIEPFFEDFPGFFQTEGEHFQTEGPFGAGFGEVDVPEGTGDSILIENLRNDFDGEACGLFEIWVRIHGEGDGDGGDAEEGSFDGGGDGAGVEDVDSGIGTAVDAADDDVGFGFAEFLDAEFRTIGGAAIDFPSEVGLAAEDFLNDQGLEVGDGMGDTALIDGGGDDLDVSEMLEFFVEGGEAGGVDAIIVG